MNTQVASEAKPKKGTVVELAEKTPFGVDKIKRYGWTVQDEPGEMRLLHKDVLKIHPAYQRDLIVQKVGEITANWSWVALGALVVGERGGEFWVIDGQHRASAAKRRSDITHLPCVVFQTADVKQEARGFLTIQTCRKPVTAVAKQKAMVTAGDEVAAYVQSVIGSLGLKITTTAKKPLEIKCVGWCMKRAEDDKDAFRKVLTLCTELSVKEGLPVPERLLEGLWVLHEKVEGGLDNVRLLKRLRDKGCRKLVDAASRASAYLNRGGGLVWAGGMLGEMNKGIQERFQITMAGEQK